MAAAVPVIGAIVVAFVVSKVVQKIGPKLGLSQEMSNMLGMVAGAYAGGMTYAAATPTAAASTTPAGADLGSGAGASNAAPSAQLTAESAGAGAFNPASAAPQHIAGATPPPTAPTAMNGTATIPATADQAALSRMTESAARPSGMLTEPPDLMAATKTPTPASTPPVPEKSWTERLFSPEKTMDLVMATAQGWAQGGAAQEALEYDENVDKSNEKDWVKRYPGQKSIGYRPPSQQPTGG